MGCSFTLIVESSTWISASNGRNIPLPSGVMLKLFGSNITTIGNKVLFVTANFPLALPLYSTITGWTVCAYAVPAQQQSTHKIRANISNS